MYHGLWFSPAPFGHFPAEPKALPTVLTAGFDAPGACHKKPFLILFVALKITFC